MKGRSIAGLLLCLLVLGWTAGCAGGPGTGTNESTTAAAIPEDSTAGSPEDGAGVHTTERPGETEPGPAWTGKTEPTAGTGSAEPPTGNDGSEPGETATAAAGSEEDPVENILKNLTLEERVAQLFVVTPEVLTGGGDPVTEAGPSLRDAFARIPVGGLLLMGCNLKSPDQVRTLCAGLQDLSLERVGLPVFLCVDEEGGSVARISGKAAFGLDPIPPMSQVGAAGDPEAARTLGATVGTYLRDLGLNVDLAPVADVLTNPKNTVIGDRAFGTDAETVISMAGAFADGLADAGVLPCWKHFPGHGGTAEDSHRGAAVLHLDYEGLLASEELKPFLAAVDRGAPMIMTGHIAVPEATGDELPASLSGTLISLLRGPERQYEGLLITDALNMDAVAGRFGSGEAAVLALRAGNDLLLYGGGDLKEVYEAVLAAVREGTISEERIDESVRRILRAKNDLP